MFSGIVETIGTIINQQNIDDCLQLIIEPKLLFDDLALGDSVAVNGVCLTVTAFTQTTFTVSVVPETLRLTNIATAQTVNLERALKYNARVGGHHVQGHIDALGEILNINNDGQGALLVTISIPEKLAKYVVNKGFITLDGMSITVIEACANCFTVTFIPHTIESTIVNQFQCGRKINIEVDILGKYIEKLIGAYQ